MRIKTEEADVEDAQYSFIVFSSVSLWLWHALTYFAASVAMPVFSPQVYVQFESESLLETKEQKTMSPSPVIHMMHCFLFQSYKDGS